MGPSINHVVIDGGKKGSGKRFFTIFVWIRDQDGDVQNEKKTWFMDCPYVLECWVDDGHRRMGSTSKRSEDTTAITVCYIARSILAIAIYDRKIKPLNNPMSAAMRYF